MTGYGSGQGAHVASQVPNGISNIGSISRIKAADRGTHM